MNESSGTYDSSAAARPATWVPFQTGHDSAVNELRFVVCRSADEWQTVWSKHRSNQLPAPTAPEVDWSSEMVVGLVLGQRPTAGYEVAIDGIEVVGDRMEFRAKEVAPNPDLVQAQMITCPYAFCRVERFDGRVDLVLAND